MQTKSIFEIAISIEVPLIFYDPYGCPKQVLHIRPAHQPHHQNLLYTTEQYIELYSVLHLLYNAYR